MGISYSTLYFLGQEIKKKRKTNTLLELWKIAQQAYEITIWLFLGCFFFYVSCQKQIILNIC